MTTAAKFETPTKVSATDTATNKAIAYRAQHELIVEQDMSALERYFSQDCYVQHNAALRNGFEELSIFKKANIPKTTSEILRCLGDRDLVFFLERVTGLVPEPVCFFDIYRMEDGKIVEHWDAYMRTSGPNPSGRTMFEGTQEIGDPASTEATRAVAIKLISNVFILDKLDRLDRYVHEDVRQYSPGIADGRESLRQHFLRSQWFTGAVQYRALRKVVAEGDFALTACDAVIGTKPYMILDLWRVQKGKVAEHWSLRQEVQPSLLHDNPPL